MSRMIDAAGAAGLLREAQDVLIITHKNPDGDALGSGFALCAALRARGKRARVENEHKIHERYEYMYGPMSGDEDFEPRFVMAVDTASLELMGARFEPYEDRIDLCIDHHGTNTRYAASLCLDASAASCAEVVTRVLDELGAEITPYIADCLYTGVSTDTGCFRYSSTTASCHLLAARLFERGCDVQRLNKLLFETKSRERIRLEQAALSGLEFALGGRAAIISISQKLLGELNCDASEIEGITAIPRTIEGVEAGITFRELKNGNWKASLRTVTVDAAAVCAVFGGGGHIRAAGFESSDGLEETKRKLLAALEGVMGA